MESNNVKFWMGLGIGSVIGIMGYRFSRSRKGRRLKHKVCDALHKAADATMEKADSLKEKVYSATAAKAEN